VSYHQIMTLSLENHRIPFLNDIKYSYAGGKFKRTGLIVPSENGTGGMWVGKCLRI